MPKFLYIFGYETPRQKRNNLAHQWEDENSLSVLVEAADEAAALRWGDRIAQRYVAELHRQPEADWSVEGYASWIEHDWSQFDTHDWPEVKFGEYPDFKDWHEADSV